MNRSPIIVFLDPIDLQQAIEGLDDLLVIKVSNSEICQKVWDQASWLSTKHALALGVIRQEWKESSNYFSQFFHLPHDTPQLVQIQKGRMKASWIGKEGLKAFLKEESLSALSNRKAQLCELLAFRMLSGVSEMTAGAEGWHQKWFKEWLGLLSEASFNEPLKELLESFRTKWYPVFQTSWNEFSLDNRVLFVKEAIELREVWAKSYSSKR